MNLNESSSNLKGFSFALDPSINLTVKTLKDSITGLTIPFGLLKSVGHPVAHGSGLPNLGGNGLHVCLHTGLPIGEVISIEDGDRPTHLRHLL